MIIDLSKESLYSITLHNKPRKVKWAVDTKDKYDLHPNISDNLEAIYKAILPLMFNHNITIYFSHTDYDHIIYSDHWFWERLKNSVEIFAKRTEKDQK